MNKILLISYILLSLIFSCKQEEKTVTKDIDTGKIEEVHPKYRKWPSPSGSIEPETNPPSLLWPVTDKRNYSVRMSRDSTFRKEVIHKDGLQWAVYNPHRKLKPGTWYWQFKSDNEEWSKKAAFVISGNTDEFVTPEAAEIFNNIPKSHPRVLIWKKELKSFRSRAAEYEDSRLIILEADSRLNNTMPDEEDAQPTFEGANEYQTKKIAKDFSKRVGNKVLDNAEPVCQAFILTREQKYVNTALPWARKISSWDPEGPTSTNDFGDSKILYSLALIYDTFYDHLTEHDKEIILRAIKARVPHFYEDWVNYLEAKQVSNHVWQFNLYRVFMTALAVKGEVPDAEKWLSYIYEVWLARSPVLGGNDGGWVHGVSYFHINTLTLLDIPATLQDISGIDFIRDEFYQNNINWLVHAYPPHSTCDGFGDGSEKKFAPDLRILGYVDAIARLNQDPLASWYIEKSMNEDVKSIARNKDFRWYRLRRGYQTPKPEAANNMPLSEVYPDVGMVYMHSNLNDRDSNLMVAMRSSPYGSYSHMHADQNTFNIAYGGKRLFFNSGYKVSMSDKHSLGWYKATQGHNGILVDGKGEVQSSSGWGWIPRFLHGAQISYAVGDASNAYDGEDKQGVHKTGLKKFRRHVLMLRPNIIVIYDELENSSKSSFSWLVHNYEEITIDKNNNLVKTQNGVATSEIALAGSQPLHFEVTDKFAIEPVNFRKKDNKNDKLYPDQWHFKAINKKKSKKMRFLAIIQVNPAGSESLRVEQLDQGKYKAGGWQIEAELNVNEKAGLSAKKADQTAAFTSFGELLLNENKYGKNQGDAKLIEIIEGDEIIRSTSDQYPSSFYEAYANSK